MTISLKERSGWCPGVPKADLAEEIHDFGRTVPELNAVISEPMFLPVLHAIFSLPPKPRTVQDKMSTQVPENLSRRMITITGGDPTVTRSHK